MTRDFIVFLLVCGNGNSHFLQFPAVQMTPLLTSGAIPTQEQLEAFQKQQVELLTQLQKQQQKQQGNAG